MMDRLPAFLSTKIWSGHYLVFELVGILLTLWAFHVSKIAISPKESDD